jgi:hypothetical protein
MICRIGWQLDIGVGVVEAVVISDEVPTTNICDNKDIGGRRPDLEVRAR